MLLGQTSDLLSKTKFSSQEFLVEIKEGKNVHRVLNGPYVSRMVFWPTLAMVEGRPTLIFKSVQIPPEGSKIINLLSSFEKEAKRLMGETEPTSQFKPTVYYLYLIFDRADPKPVVKIGRYKYTIFKRLNEIQSERSSRDESKLKNGLIFMYDVIIKKTVEDPKRPQYSTSYSVDPDSENNPFMGQIPAELLNYSAAELDKVLKENNLYEKIFTPEELKAMEECTIDLEKETRALSEEEIMAKLKEFPVYLGAKDRTGKYYFPQSESFVKSLESLEIKYIENEDQVKPKNLIKEPEEKEVNVELDNSNTTDLPVFNLPHSSKPDNEDQSNEGDSLLKRWE